MIVETHRLITTNVKNIVGTVFNKEHVHKVQKIKKVIYPQSCHLSVTDKLQICYLSFPDSNNNRERDTTYHFRFKRSSISLPTSHNTHFPKFKSLAPVPLKPHFDYLFGFVHFRQQKDAFIPRGYFQKSVVLLTALPLFSLFSHIVDNIAYNFFESGKIILEKACQHIDEWPAPNPGETLNMRLLNVFILCRIPSRKDVLQQQIFLESREVPLYNTHIHSLLPMMKETYFYESAKKILPHIQCLWELILLGEPVMIMAPTPAQCSQLVQSLVLLIWPLQYSNDYRPYFTIHDTDFNEVASKRQIPNIVIGVTNPFFAKTLNHWPHILRIDNGEISDNSDDFFKSDKYLKRILNGKKVESKPGFYSQHKQFLHQDKSLLKKLLKVGNRPDTVQNAILRKHFLELTQTFMIPLERHISSLLPLQKQISPFKALPQMKPFLLDEFLCTFEQSNLPSTCAIKGDWRGFYKRFITDSPIFREWLSQRLDDVNDRLRITHSEMLSTVNLNTENLGKFGHVEVVDLVLRLKDRLTDLSSENKTERNKILAQLNNIMMSVDDELKSILLSSEALRDILNLI